MEFFVCFCYLFLFLLIPGRSSPLHAATQYNFPYGVKILLERGVPAVWMDQAGFTPLHYAACLHDTSCLEMLVVVFLIT